MQFRISITTSNIVYVPTYPRSHWLWNSNDFPGISWQHSSLAISGMCMLTPKDSIYNKSNEPGQNPLGKSLVLSQSRETGSSELITCLIHSHVLLGLCTFPFPIHLDPSEMLACGPAYCASTLSLVSGARYPLDDIATQMMPTIFFNWELRPCSDELWSSRC